ncbi:hypothetical protein FHS27_005053 [Rhodopirellula rubra]|uniref:Uncharacterized protein n=1 Tax=Aporhodopirellula rubra TaxID=980271 RepID=A0A7W5H8L7_9BACT|nr:hypothetical protein [Aporhodopirellula rubra]
MDAKKHPSARYENSAIRERQPAQNVESSDDASEFEFAAFGR